MVEPNLEVKASEVFSSDRLLVEGSSLVPLSSVAKDGDQMRFLTVNNEHFSFHQDEICRVYRYSIPSEDWFDRFIFLVALAFLFIFGYVALLRLLVLLFNIE